MPPVEMSMTPDLRKYVEDLLISQGIRYEVETAFKTFSRDEQIDLARESAREKFTELASRLDDRSLIRKLVSISYENGIVDGE